MLGLKRVHHIAIIATDYAKSKAFYCDILGFTLQGEFYREERDSWKGDLALNGEYVIELFSFPFPPRLFVPWRHPFSYHSLFFSFPWRSGGKKTAFMSYCVAWTMNATS